jgi:putative membrane protein
MQELLALLAGVPKFVTYLALSLAVAMLFVAIYVRITPYRELELIRNNNVAAALSLGGSFLGFCLPLAVTISYSVNVLDFLLWALVAMVVQIGVHFLMRALIPGLTDAVKEGRTAVGTLSAFVAIGLGTLNAACLTP